jgi:hypothetical protein
MGIKVDRPMDDFADGIVVYMAKSVDEVNKARAGFEAAEIPVLLPEAAVEALFAAGKESLPIRVRVDDYKRAVDVIDELFPPPELILPPLEEEVPADAPIREAAQTEDAGREGPHLEGVAAASAHTPREGKKAPKLAKLKTSLLKLMFIAAISIFLPGIGLLAAGFALYGSIWALRALDVVVGGEEEIGRAKWAIGISSGALLVNVGALVYLAWLQGWLG